MAKRKPYQAKTLSGAQAYVRSLQKQVDHIIKLFEECHSDRLLMARIAADGPAFNNPLEAMAAKLRRDELLREWCKLNPDGSPLSAASPPETRAALPSAPPTAAATASRAPSGDVQASQPRRRRQTG
jgi:hypothetical protein